MTNHETSETREIPRWVVSSKSRNLSELRRKISSHSQFQRAGKDRVHARGWVSPAEIPKKKVYFQGPAQESSANLTLHPRVEYVVETGLGHMLSTVETRDMGSHLG